MSLGEIIHRHEVKAYATQMKWICNENFVTFAYT